jgi:hypothetical protein
MYHTVYNHIVIHIIIIIVLHNIVRGNFEF